jgi:lipoate-protein ligase A
MKWRILNTGKMSPAMNMAVDEAIFIGVKEKRSLPAIRFYGWNPPSISFGYNQKFSKEIDLKALKKFGFGYVRRPTGGRAVLHDEEVTYSVITPISEELSGSILESYSEISRALARGLKNLGIEVEFEKSELSSNHQRQAANPCFSSSSRFELNYQKKKIVGSAQVRKDNTLLQHGSILLQKNQSKLAYVIPNLSDEQHERLAVYLSKKTIAINEILNEPVNFDDAVSAMINGFKMTWQTDEFMVSEDIEKWEKEKAEFLANTKYLTVEWDKRN